MILLKIGIVIIVGITAFFLFAPQFGGRITRTYQEVLERSPNYSEGKFVNPVETNMPVPKLSVMLEFFRKGNNREPNYELKTKSFGRKEFIDKKDDDELSFSWFGHSSVLLNIEGKVLLIDPVFSERASLFSFAGPKSFTYSDKLEVEDLPQVDAVLISHDHYDHLDYSTIRKLKDKVDAFFVPLGVRVHLEAWGVPADKITELDWWDEIPLDQNIELVFTPTRHFSGRGLADRDKTQWGAWAVIGNRKKVFFTGDSGYFNGFQKIGAKYGPFDLAFIECGQYNEAWSSIHMMPEQSAQVGEDLKARVVVPIHWGKFKLSLHSWTEPVERFLTAAQDKNYQVLTPRLNEVVALKNIRPETWWRREVPQLVEQLAR
ncbi:MAG: MBL fold metallo-hydrolase [Marinifilaceae bacterium]